MKLPYRLALVTGASSGIGKAVATLLAQEGIELIVTGRESAELSKFNATSYVCDLTDAQQVKGLCRLIEERVPDLIINNAGIGRYGSPLLYPVEEALELVQVNCTAYLQVALAAVKALFQSGQKGCLLNVTSASAFLPMPGYTIYAATKAFQRFFSEALQVELEEAGIQVLTSCPGQVATAFRKRASRGTAGPYPKGTLSVDAAAKRIVSQIRKGKKTDLFPLRDRLGLFLLERLFSRQFAMHFLNRFKPDVSSKTQ